MTVTEPLNVVKEFKIGNTRIRISDDYCRDKTPQDVEEILKHIATKALEHLNSVAVNSTESNQ